METRDILRTLREGRGLTQDALAERVMVTRQAVSRWETGETQPNTETLKLLSREFDVSINALLGAPRQLFCQCCGMPLTEDGTISREPDGAFNENYCEWCYADGEFAYQSLDALLDYIAPHMARQLGAAPEALRPQIEARLMELEYWKEKADR
ncbi:MAG: helix-turn-helix domain-containing protein [Clostridia bacterium]|nr:helix-turn-helix domain-containing protein [Clostridia bacterium]